MKILKKLAILFLAFTVFSCIQQKQYVSYKTKKGETMSSIAKRHHTTESELLKINPGIGKNPPANTYIIVPKISGRNNSSTQNNKNHKNDTPTSNPAEKYSTYTVRKGDTLYSLSKRFGVSIDELIRRNPSLKDGLKTGMTLNLSDNLSTEIPQKEVVVGYDNHKVVKGDTVYNLTRRYNISSDELYKANPELANGLKLGMTLRIPKKGFIDSNSEIESNEKEESSLMLDNFSTGKVANIAVLLPYQLNKLKNNDAIEKKFQSKNSLTNIATDFHEGVEMAIDSLKRRGVRVNVSFFDTENSKRKLANLILQNNFNKYDAIIGPLFFENAQVLASQINDVPIVLPFYSKKQTNNATSNLIKSMPNEDEVENKLIDYIKANHTNEKILVVTDNKSDTKSKLWRVVKKLKEISMVKNISILKPEKGYIDRERFNEKIKPKEKNWVILVGDDAVTVSDVVNNLGTYSDEEYKIQLFAFEKGANFDGLVNNNYLGKLHFTYPTSVYTNTSSPKVKAFYNNFKRKNNTLPNKYALRGFDVAYDVVARLVSYQTLTDGMTRGKSERLTSTFEYNNLNNNSVMLVRYNDDLSIETIR